MDEKKSSSPALLNARSCITSSLDVGKGLPPTSPCAVPERESIAGTSASFKFDRQRASHPGTAGERTLLTQLNVSEEAFPSALRYLGVEESLLSNVVPKRPQGDGAYLWRRSPWEAYFFLCNCSYISFFWIRRFCFGPLLLVYPSGLGNMVASIFAPCYSTIIWYPDRIC